MYKTNSISEQEVHTKQTDSGLLFDKKTSQLAIYTEPELRATFQRYLAQLFAKNRNQVCIKQAANILRLSHSEAGNVLQHMTCLEWLKQTKLGFYTLTASTPEKVVDWNTDDPWVIASKNFNPCYIGGYSAALYWGLTDRYGADSVSSQQKIDAEQTANKNYVYYVQRTKPELFFGLDTVCQQGIQVALSDPSRTLIDFIADPDAFAGMDDVLEIFHFYMNSQLKDLGCLTKYIFRFDNYPILFKRFGFLLERFYPKEQDFLNLSKKWMSNEDAGPDNTPPTDKLAQKWRIWLPDNCEQNNRNQTGVQVYEISNGL
ncbi:MAG: hypothetical protein ABFQ95_07545, partial [Pseudomonadota bacterium]